MSPRQLTERLELDPVTPADSWSDRILHNFPPPVLATTSVHCRPDHRSERAIRAFLLHS